MQREHILNTYKNIDNSDGNFTNTVLLLQEEFKLHSVNLLHSVQYVHCVLHTAVYITANGACLLSFML